MLSVETQNNVVFLVAAFVVGLLLRRFFKKQLAPALSRYFLKRGRVRWAMWFRSKSTHHPGCRNCP